MLQVLEKKNGAGSQVRVDKVELSSFLPQVPLSGRISNNVTADPVQRKEELQFQLRKAIRLRQERIKKELKIK